MEKLIINGNTHQYIGEPLLISMFDGQIWDGRSNLLHGKKISEPELLNIQDCFVWMNKFTQDENYICGYILDFVNKIVYYDTDEAYYHFLRKTSYSQLHMENYFLKFTKRDFAE